MNIDSAKLLTYFYIFMPGVIVLLVTIASFLIVKKLIFSQLSMWGKKDFAQEVNDQVKEVVWLTSIVTGLYLAAVITPEATPEFTKALYFLLILVWGWQLIRMVIKLINFTVDKAIAKNQRSDAAAYKFMGAIAKVIVWIVLLLTILSNLGYDVSSLIAGLGISGIAIALAVQSLLGDFISSLSIVADKPFKVGDLISVNGFKGKVDRIGIRSTLVKSVDGEDLIIPNSELVKSVIQNFSDVHTRRSQHTIGVVYETDQKLLQDIPVMILDVLNSIQHIDQASNSVHLIKFADSSLNFDVSFEVIGKDYAQFLDTQQEALFKIFKKLTDEGVEFAYPTQVSYNKDGASSSN
jgi:small-conductance mechanosensitive channel